MTSLVPLAVGRQHPARRAPRRRGDGDDRAPGEHRERRGHRHRHRPHAPGPQRGRGDQLHRVAARRSDDNGHGTHVAGIIGARNQGSGAVGVAPGTKIYAVKVLNASGSGYTSQIVCGIDWVTSTRTDSDPNNDISVVNMSLGGGSSPTANCGTSVGDVEHMAICRAIAAGVELRRRRGQLERRRADLRAGQLPRGADGHRRSATPTGCRAASAAARRAGSPTATTRRRRTPTTRRARRTSRTRSPRRARASARPTRAGCTRRCRARRWPRRTSPGLVALCMGENGAHGPCWGKTPAQVIRMMIDASTTDGGAGAEHGLLRLAVQAAGQRALLRRPGVDRLPVGARR